MGSLITSGTTITTTTTTTITTTPQTSDIDVNIAWTYLNGITSVKMIINNLKISQWVSIGLSLDDLMVFNRFSFLQKNTLDFFLLIGRRSCIYLSTFIR
jgi:hypothetical protein